MKKNECAYWSVIILAIVWCFVPSLTLAEVKTTDANWRVDYIDKVPAILMKEPLLELLGQVDQPIAYSFKEAAKISGHACSAVAGAWIITRKALERLYPTTVPVRGQIKVIMPGAKDEWVVGVFGQVISNITGAAPETGFPGAELGPAFNRRNLMIYSKQPAGTSPAEMLWIFERTDTKTSVAVKYNLSLIEPQATPEYKNLGIKITRGLANPEEIEKWQSYWNARVKFVFDNADTLPGLFTVEELR